MFLRRLGWIVASLLVGGCFTLVLTFVARRSATTDRLAAADRRNHEHAEAVRQLRPTALATLHRIENEPMLEHEAEWAGSYGWSWREGRQCGNYVDKDYQEHLALSASGDVVWWFGTSGIASAEFVDCGRVTAVDSSRIVVEWTLSSRTPHVLFDPWEPTPLLCDELVRIEGRGATYLLPAIRVPLFCASDGRAFPNAAVFAPQRGEWKGERGLLAVELPPREARIPAPWNEYVLPAPLTATATSIDDPVCVLRYERPYVPWWKRLIGQPDNGWYQWTFEVPLGSHAGVKPGMRMRLEPGGDTSGIVESVQPDSCRVRFVMSNTMLGMPRTGLTVQTIH